MYYKFKIIAIEAFHQGILIFFRPFISIFKVYRIWLTSYIIQYLVIVFLKVWIHK
jgi:hypothetical protein